MLSNYKSTLNWFEECFNFFSFLKAEMKVIFVILIILLHFSKGDGFLLILFL